MSSRPDFWTRQQVLWALPVTCASERLLMLALCFHQGDNDEAWPAQETLAGELGLKVRQTRTLIERLRKRGWISVRRAWPNRYAICWDRLPESGTPLPDSPRRKRHSTAGQKRHSAADSKPRNRHPSAIERSALNIQKNTHAGDAGSKNRNGWSGGGITADELRSPEAVQKRFSEAVDRGYCQSTDRLPFFTLAEHVAQTDARNPGALFTRLLKDKSWPGSDSEEDTARAAIRQLDRQTGKPANGHALRLASALAVDLPDGGRDDG